MQKIFFRISVVMSFQSKCWVVRKLLLFWNVKSALDKINKIITNKITTCLNIAKIMLVIMMIIITRRSCLLYFIVPAWVLISNFFSLPRSLPKHWKHEKVPPGKQKGQIIPTAITFMLISEELTNTSWFLVMLFEGFNRTKRSRN